MDFRRISTTTCHSELCLQRGAIEESQYSLVILSCAHVDGLTKNLKLVMLPRFLAYARNDNKEQGRDSSLTLGMTIEKRNDNKSRNNKKKKEKQYQGFNQT